ncbi:NAD-dependent epimerase/dehydratase family protein [Campylobacter coli]|uniref:NAD-dependent epimerase/dehydratase family protein n=1 Tax=Campylobacter coli TaxID=195 RepID=UPI001D620254|nr:NAD-dependent epimerase/dehydratase family protein [Campylobacter coli]EHC5632023.1 NAD-dependent epimerase/dehydratase family protein [Campylobacter coli]EHR2889934.1 NAD-dependent epimerase/dehydratase family protein [Campylobacter coli]EIC9914395.1 NAD-dependent epimerase/dehydratase family protein [Campylobacter coli]EID5127113.1 NAD-dependent epimerase/dehydratase family protein [Campylobacter coli]EID5172760.1 NAD-dependent epimerase/dehydratase family protein [Campylobacter coli]
MDIKNRHKSSMYQHHIYFYIKHIDIHKLNGKTLLVTGSTGLIGTFFIDVLMYSNVDVRLIILCRDVSAAKAHFAFFRQRKNLLYIEIDICKKIELPMPVDYIIHLASPADPLNFAKHPIQTIETNILSTKELLDISVCNKAKIIFSSSGEIYGDCKISKIQENDFGYIDCLDVRSCYNESKRLAETLCKAYAIEKNIEFVILRIPRCFGPTMRSNDSRSISSFLRNAVMDEDVWLKSSGEQYYSYVYVGDCVTSIFYAMFYLNSNEAYNLGNDEKIKLLDMAKMISNLNPKIQLKHLVFDEFKDKGYSKVLNSILDTSKITFYGWRPFFSVQEGLEISYKILKDIKNVK